MLYIITGIVEREPRRMSFHVCSFYFEICPLMRLVAFHCIILGSVNVYCWRAKCLCTYLILSLCTLFDYFMAHVKVLLLLGPVLVNRCLSRLWKWGAAPRGCGALIIIFSNLGGTYTPCNYGINYKLSTFQTVSYITFSLS